MRYGLSEPAYETVRVGLLARATSRWPNLEYDNVVRLISQALKEFIDPACRVCRGVGEIITDKLRVTCPTCNGSKLHRYSDSERSHRMELSYGLTKLYAKKLQWLADSLNKADRLAGAGMSVQLER